MKKKRDKATFALMYKSIIRPLLYSMPPERAHYFVTGWLEKFYHLGLLQSPITPSFKVNDARLERKLFGLTFPNPVGLAAGFDKDAKWIDSLTELGFGFLEIGTVTPLAQPGNPKPRMYRLIYAFFLALKKGNCLNCLMMLVIKKYLNYLRSAVK